MKRHLFRVTLLGALTGLVAGVVVLAFRWLIFSGQATFLPEHSVGNYEALDPRYRWALPVLGGLVLGWLYERLPPATREVGVVYVLAKLRTAGGGLLSVRNAVVQFFFGAAVIVTGHSVDREGPSVHLGATCGSFLGVRAGLTHRDRRTLIACGAAAAVAAAFNTPLAGAIFAIEVTRFRYNIARFMPVTMASVIGAVVVRVASGGAPSFPFTDVGIESMLELPGVALIGLVAGAVAGAFTAASQYFARRFRGVRPALGFTAAGAVTGALALLVPQIMGVGTDVLQAMLTRELPAVLLLGIVLCKVLATAVAVGFRVPGGLIGPTLVIGGAIGGLTHFLLDLVAPGALAPSGFYGMIGMAAMMAAALHAPMAALIALLELTGSPAVILPGMLAIVTADGVCRMLLGKESVFVAVLRVLQAPATKPASNPED